MEKIVSATEANRDFSRILGEVIEGQTVVITTRGKRVARIEPETVVDVAEDRRRRDAAWDGLLKRLRSQPAMNLPRLTRDDFYD